MSKHPSSPRKDQAELTKAAARMLDAAAAEPIPERIAHLAEQLEKALARAQATLKSSDEGR